MLSVLDLGKQISPRLSVYYDREAIRSTPNEEEATKEVSCDTGRS